MESGTDQPGTRAYQKTLRDWREFHKKKGFVKLKEEMEECDAVEQTLKNKIYTFLVEKGIHSLEEIDWDVRVSYGHYLEKTINKKNQPWYLKGLDKLKLFDIEKRNFITVGIPKGSFGIFQLVRQKNSNIRFLRC